MIFTIQTGVGPLPLKFGILPNDVQGILGLPNSKRKTLLNEWTWNYGDHVTTFGTTNELVEVGFSPTAQVMFEGINLFRDENSFQLVVTRTLAFEHMGFIILPEFGLTFAGFHDKMPSDRSITMFVAGRWDPIRSSYKRFVLHN